MAPGLGEDNCSGSTCACCASIFRKLDGEFDWDMPGMTGGDVLDRLRSSPATKDVPVLVITGREGAAAESMVLERGADDCWHNF